MYVFCLEKDLVRVGPCGVGKVGDGTLPPNGSSGLVMPVELWSLRQRVLVSRWPTAAMTGKNVHVSLMER